MRTKLSSLFIGLVFSAGIHQTTAQVTNLGIAPVPGGQSLIYWPTSGTTNELLQTTASLSSPDWVTATNAVTVNAVTVTNSAPSGYFRLLLSTNPPGMVLIPAGSFTIGNYVIVNFYTVTNDSDLTDARPTNVYVSAFYMDENLVSSNQWAGVYTYATNHGYGFDDAGSDKAGNYPVETVNWYDCVKWCNARSQQSGLMPVYYTDAGFTQLYTNGDLDAIYPNWAANGYRLPTEAEWEKAARGGLTGNRFPWGNFITEAQANYYPSGYGYDLSNSNIFDQVPQPWTSPVGSFAPNGYGLYDMTGNVNQWCWDWYAEPPYPAGSPYLGGTNPTGAGPGSGVRTARGGWWNEIPEYARCAFRYTDTPSTANAYFGFRSVRRP